MKGLRQGGWGMRGASVRDTLGERGPGVTPAPLSQKRGRWREGWGGHPCSWLLPCEALLLPLSSFTGALFHMQTVAVAPTCLAKSCIQTGREWGKREEGVALTGWGARVWLGEEGVGMSPKMPVSFKPLMSRLCPPWESSRGTKAPLFLPTHHLPSAVSLFSGWMNLSEAAAHCGGIIDGDYPNFMLPSHCEEVPWVLVLRAAAMQQQPRGVVVATLCGPERKGWRGKRKLAATHAAYKHTASTHGPYKGRVWLEILAEKESLTSLLNFYLTEEDQIKVCGTF